MTREDLVSQIRKKKSFLCVGLDTDINKIPPHLLDHEDPVFEFNKAIIDATNQLAIAYKPNLAFYESRGTKGWVSLERTIAYLNQTYPEVFTIADAKRGDIGNSSKMYATAFFNTMGFDAVTIAPYMGEDSVKPFLEHPGKWVILLALTSNPGAKDFQFYAQEIKPPLYQSVIETSKTWTRTDCLMYVVGATKAQMLGDIRKLIPDHFLLVPGVGAQGGSLSDVAKYGLNKNCGLIVNSSRGILYASNGEDFAEKAHNSAKIIRDEMECLLDAHNFS